MADYDELYARVVGDRAVLYDPSHALHGDMAQLLTPDSPLAPTWIAGGHSWDEFRSVRAVQLSGEAGLELSVLEPGERSSELPFVRELLGDLPDRVAGVVEIAACSHSEYSIEPEGDPHSRPWVEAALDNEVDTTVTFRAVDGVWRLHDWQYVRQVPRNDVCDHRCGDDPAGTAHRNTRTVPIDENGDGEFEQVQRPTPVDPPCAGQE